MENTTKRQREGEREIERGREREGERYTERKRDRERQPMRMS